MDKDTCSSPMEKLRLPIERTSRQPASTKNPKRCPSSCSTYSSSSHAHAAKYLGVSPRGTDVLSRSFQEDRGYAKNGRTTVERSRSLNSLRPLRGVQESRRERSIDESVATLRSETLQSDPWEHVIQKCSSHDGSPRSNYSSVQDNASCRSYTSRSHCGGLGDLETVREFPVGGETSDPVDDILSCAARGDASPRFRSPRIHPSIPSRHRSRHRGSANLSLLATSDYSGSECDFDQSTSISRESSSQSFRLPRREPSPTAPPSGMSNSLCGGQLGMVENTFAEILIGAADGTLSPPYQVIFLSFKLKLF